MKLLLDTHAFIWFATDHKNLSKKARRALERQSNEVYLSIASIWEMRIKLTLAKLRLPASLSAVVQTAVREAGIKILPIDLSHVFELERLPTRPHDPFDRLLASQALCESMHLVTKDEIFEAYPITVLW